MKTKSLIAAALCLGLAFCASSQAKLERQKAKDPRYQYNMGLLYLNSPSATAATLDQAVSYFDRAIALNPKYYLAWNARGLAQVMKGDLAEASRSFQKCLQLNPSFSEARNNLGSVYESQGLTSLAEEEYRKAIADETYPTKELPYYNLARMSFALGRYDDALTYIQKSLEANPRFAMAFNMKGMIFEKMRLPADAVTSYEQAVKLVPEDMNFQFNLAVALFESGDLERAGEIFSLILSKTTDPELRTKVAEYKRKIK
jgi:tetratricopeptide (TPR) repeat protein